MIRRIQDRDFTIFSGRQDAEEVARRNTADDPEGWRYKVVKRPSGFVVEVYDAANRYMGAYQEELGHEPDTIEPRAYWAILTDVQACNGWREMYDAVQSHTVAAYLLDNAGSADA